MAQRVAHNPLQDAFTTLLNHARTGRCRRCPAHPGDEASKIERGNFRNAGAYERSAERVDYAKGFKPKSMQTRLGEIIFAVPQVRGGGFYPKPSSANLQKRSCTTVVGIRLPLH
ncbi:MAG: hypothetical protein EXR27_02930 [Betaproteobacteria bacterium]|nr:hypothetical protein [Betaproteobacteria bacterium]